jgi:voltage-gated potassium channel
MRQVLSALRPNRTWLGMAGVPPHDNAGAYAWERRLHGIMLGAALLAIFAFYLVEVQRDSELRAVGYTLEWVIFLAFLGELLWMLLVTRQKLQYFLGNWLDVMIVAAVAFSIAGHETEWVAWARLLRVAMVGMVLARALAEIRVLFSPGGLPYIFGFAMLSLLVAGAGFYWLDPRIGSYADGLWLAFVTAATVGYGDLVPTTPASRVLAVFVVVIGVALLSTVTAAVAAFFIGEDEKRLRKELHQDIRELRRETAQLIDEEERALRRAMHEDVRRLRDEIRALRTELARNGLVRDADDKS